MYVCGFFFWLFHLAWKRTNLNKKYWIHIAGGAAAAAPKQAQWCFTILHPICIFRNKRSLSFSYFHHCILFYPFHGTITRIQNAIELTLAFKQDSRKCYLQKILKWIKCSAGIGRCFASCCWWDAHCLICGRCASHIIRVFVLFSIVHQAWTNNFWYFEWARKKNGASAFVHFSLKFWPDMLNNWFFVVKFPLFFCSFCMCLCERNCDKPWFCITRFSLDSFELEKKNCSNSKWNLFKMHAHDGNCVCLAGVAI